MHTEKDNTKDNARSYKDKNEPKWYPGDAGGAHKSTDRVQKSNKAPFKKPENDSE